MNNVSWFEYSSGVSIHTNVERIFKVSTFVKKTKRSKLTDKILGYLNLDWNNIPFTINNPLPEYLEIKYHRDILEIIRIKPFRKEDNVNNFKNNVHKF